MARQACLRFAKSRKNPALMLSFFQNPSVVTMSDSDSSDDDLLAGGPTFGKAASRKEKANEKKQLNFLDNIMSKATQRKERNERIGSLMAEANAARAAAAAAAAEASATNGGEVSPSNTSGQGASPSVASATSSASKQSAVGGTANGGTAPTKRAMNTYDVDDPEYWERVNAARGPRNSAEGRAKRRRQIDDAVDGIDDLSTDEEGGADDDSPEARKRKKALASARATGLSTLLGTRKVFLPTGMEVNSRSDSGSSSRNGSSSLPFRVIGGPTPRTTPTFASANDALMALQKILDSLTKSAGKRGPVDRKKVEKDVESTILRSLKAACEGGTLVLSQYLSHGTLPSVCSDKALPLPRPLVTWLFLASCSGAAIRTLSFGACQTLMTIIKSKTRIVDFGAGDNINVKVAMVADLKPGLEILFRLWTKEGPAPATVEEASDDEEEEGDSKKKRYRASDSYLDNVSGLTHFLSVWATALDHDCVVTKEANVKKEENENTGPAWNDDESKDVTLAVAALARASLDPTFHSGRHDLINSLKWLLVALTEYNARRLAGRGNTSDADTSKLYSSMAKAVCDACSGLSAGPEKAADEDDEEGLLPISLGIRTLPIEHCYGRSSTSALKLKAATVLCAFKMCLECDDGWWADSVKEIFAKYAKGLEDKKLSDRWSIMTSTEVGLRRIQSAGSEITSDYPRFLACIEISVACAEMGMALFSLLEPSLDGEGGIYGSIDQAEAMCQLLESLEILCNQLKKNLPSVFAYPHLRRGKDVLTLLSVYFRHQMVEASALAQRKGDVNLKQKSLASFRFSLSGESQLDSTQTETQREGETDEGDDDDDDDSQD